MTLLTFKKFDKILIEYPKDINKIIYGYYNDNHCKVCLKDCDNCEFCLDHRTKSEYFCECHCSCSIAWDDNWKDWYKEHYGVKIEDTPPPPQEDPILNEIDDIMNNLVYWENFQ